MLAPTSAWKTDKIEELFVYKRSNTLSRDKLNYQSGLCKNIHYGDVLVKYGCIVNVSNHAVPYITDDNDRAGDLLENGDIVVADTAEDLTVGKACEVIGTNDQLAVAGLHTIVLRPKQSIFELGFLGYYFNSEYFHSRIIPFAHGTKVTSISKSDLLQLEVVIPSRTEQQAVVTALTEIDRLIATLEEVLPKKRDMREGLAQSLLTGVIRLPGYNGNWKRIELQDALVFCTTTVPAENIILGNYVGTENMVKDRGGVATNDKALPYTRVREYLPNDILLSNIRPYLKKIWLATHNGGCSNDVIVLRSVDDECYNPTYCFLLLSRNDFFSYATNNSSGTKMPRGDKEAIKRYLLRIPESIDEQRAIADTLMTADREIADLERKLEKYKQIRQGMMRELLTGRIRLVQE